MGGCVIVRRGRLLVASRKRNRRVNVGKHARIRHVALLHGVCHLVNREANDLEPDEIVNPLVFQPDPLHRTPKTRLADDVASPEIERSCDTWSDVRYLDQMVEVRLTDPRVMS